MFTDKHFPPTFLSKNPSLRDMVKDQTDYDRRLTEISTKFEKEKNSLNGRPACNLRQSSTRPSPPKRNNPSSDYQPSSNFTGSTASTSLILPLGPSDVRLSEERAMRASQRRLMKATPTRQSNCDYGSRCSTPNIPIKSIYNNYNSVEERGANTPCILPELSYGRITHSRNLIPKLKNSNGYMNVTLHRPSEYYRSTSFDWNLTDNKPNDSFSKFRSTTHNTPGIISRNTARTDGSYYSDSATETCAPSAIPLQAEYPISFMSSRGSNSTSGNGFIAPTPRAENHQPSMSSSDKNYHNSFQSPRSSRIDVKTGPLSYHTDKYFSKHFLSSSTPLSEMVIKNT